jgi:hypothetical protein
VRRILALALCAVVGFGAASCGSGKDKQGPAGTTPPPQPTTGQTGTPAGPTNTGRTTTSADDAGGEAGDDSTP